MSLALETLQAEGWPAQLITWAQWLSLPEDDGVRLECQEGVVQMVPAPEPLHQFVLGRLVSLLASELPAGEVAVPACDVLLTEAPLTVRRPDVLVAPASVLRRRHRIVAAEVSLAVEIISPGSRRIDRALKAIEYAEAAIPDYWIVDLDEPSLTALHLGPDGGYQVVATIAEFGEVSAAGVTIAIDLGVLIDP